MKIINVIILLGLFLINGIAMADLKTGLIAYYPFKGNANDASGNNNHGTLHGGGL